MTKSNHTAALAPRGAVNRFIRARDCALTTRKSTVKAMARTHRQVPPDMKERPFDATIAAAICDAVGYRETLGKAIEPGAQISTLEEFVLLFSHTRSIPRFLAYYRIVSDTMRAKEHPGRT